MIRKMNVAFMKKATMICLLILACFCLLSGCKKEESVSEEPSEGIFKTGISYESFTDVESHSAKDYIKVMTKLGITRGRTDTTFAPDESITRAEFTEMVAYAAGLTDVKYKDIYKDVTAKMEYAGILQAAHDNGIIDNEFVTGDSFKGEDIITRKEMASMMEVGYRLLTGEDADAEALEKFVEAEPQGTSTRAEATMMLYDLQNCGKKLIQAGFDENISDWGTKIRTGTTQQGYENGSGQVVWSDNEGNTSAGSMLFDMAYTGKKQINAFQWDYTFTSADEESNVIEAGATYMITLFAKIEGAEKVKLNVIKLRHENDNEMNYSTVVDSQELSGEGWRLYCFELTATTSINEAKLLFQAGGCENHNTKIYIDDISMQKFEAKVNVKAEVEEEYQDVAVVSGVGTYGPYEEATLMAAGEKVELIKEGNWIRNILNFFIKLFNKQEAVYYLADYWTDTTYGNVIAQGSVYDFTVKSNTTVNVKYQKYDVQDYEWELPASGKTPKVTMKELDGSDDELKVSARVQIPEGYAVADCGVLYYEGCYVDNYTLFTEGADAVSATEVSDKGGYETTKTGIPSDTDVRVKAYAICKDTDNNYIVLYSDEDIYKSKTNTAEVDYKLIYNFELMNCFKNDYASQDGGYEAAWDTFISQLISTDVDMITLTPGTYRSNLWPSKVDTHWTEYAPTQEKTDFAIYERGKDYILAGGDPLQDMLDYCEKYQFEDVFINYRMNDQHKTDIEDFATHNQFYLEHPEYRLNPTSTTNNRTLNYMEPEVRDYYFGLLEELCTTYDVDGLELDFERAPIFFKDEEIEAGTEIMTNFVGKIRAMLDRVGKEKGKYLPLSVRVCDSLEESLSVGLDVATWDALGYIDIVNTTSSYRHTMSVDVESYMDVLSDDVKLYVEMQYLVDQSTVDTMERVYTTAECLRATAESYLARGVDGISAFNMDYSGNMKKTLSGLKGIADAEELKKSEKHYVLMNGYDYSTVKGVSTISSMLPVDNTLFDSALLRLETTEKSKDIQYEVYFNNVKLEMAKTITLTDETELFPRLADTAAYASADRLKYYTLPVELIQNGENTIEVKQISGDANVVRVVELAVYHKDSYALQGETRDPKTIKVNLISNGGFENGASKWTATFKDKLKALGTVTYPSTGGAKNSAYICYDIKNAGTAVGAIELFQTMKMVQIQAGKTYRLTFDAKVLGADSMNIGRIWLRNIVGDAVTLGEKTNVKVEGASWTTYTVDILAVESSSGARLLFHMGGDGATNIKFCMDNISLVETEGQTQVAEEQVNESSMLVNGGFGKLGASWTATNKIGDYKWLTQGGVDNSGCLVYNITSSSNGTKQIGDLQLYQILKDTKVKAGYTYRFTFQAKLDGTESMEIGKIWIRNNETTGKELGAKTKIIVSGNEWKTYTVDIPVTQSSDGIRMLLQMGGGVTVHEGKTVKLYLDHLCLVDIGLTPTDGSDEQGDSSNTEDSNNILVNGSLTGGGKPWFASMKVGTYQFSSEGGVDNSDCVIYNITSGSSGESKIGDLQLYQSLKEQKVEAGRTYRLTFDAKLEGVDTMTLGKIWIRNNGATSIELGTQKNIQIAGSDWKTYTVDIPVTEDCTGIRMMLQMGGGVTVPEGETVKLSIDNLCLVDYGITPGSGDEGGSGNEGGNENEGGSGNEGGNTEEDTIETVNDSSFLVNGGFGINGQSWTASSKIGTFQWLTTGGVDNSNCIVFDITSSSSGATKIGDLQLFQRLQMRKVEAGKTYQFTFQAKLEGVESMEFGKIWLRNDNENAELGAQKNIQISGGQWTSYTVDIPVTVDCTGIRMVLQMGGNVTVPDGATVKLYLDHLCLVEKEVPSVLINGELEGRTSWSPSVEANKGAAGTYAWLTSGGIDNSGCLKYEITNAGTAVNSIYLLQRMQTLELTEGETYKLTFWAKLENAESWEMGDLWLRNDSANEELSNRLSVIVSGDQWTKYSVTFTVKKTCTGVRLVLNIGNGLTVPEGKTVTLCLDNIMLQKQESAPTTFMYRMMRFLLPDIFKQDDGE